MSDFTQFVDLASERLGGRVVEASDEFFGPKENLLKQAKPIFIEGKYTARGKWMDGWETRRRRTRGHDWCIVRLGLPGIIQGIVVDTSFFRGNYPERFSLEGCNIGEQSPYKNEKKRLSSEKNNWVQILLETSLKGDSQNPFVVANESKFTHLRLRIYPDGGVARLRVHGQAVPHAKSLSRPEIDLAAAENGGTVVVSSDQFFGAPLNLLMPYPAKNMGDGWETKRRRGPGHDWVVLKLGVSGTIRRLEVDTAHFKGNFPESCSLEACYASVSDVNAGNAESQTWKEVLSKTKLRANFCHVFKELQDSGLATHLRFQIYPDGGVSRLRVFGQPEKSVGQTQSFERFHNLSRRQAVRALLDCCGSKKWAEKMAKQRPFVSPTELFESADRTWRDLQRKDWLEAFQHHPPVGGRRAAANQSATQSRWSAKEQSTAQKATPEVLAALAAGNKAYADKFGYVFLICATGKTSDEILTSLKQRMPNDAEAELRGAAAEQCKITRLRLEKLFNL
jgi:allantoicase